MGCDGGAERESEDFTVSISGNESAEINRTLGLHASGVRKGFARVVGIALLLASAYAAYAYYQRRKVAEAAVHYETCQVTRGALTVTVSATGTLEPVNEVEVGSEVSGTIKTVEADYNDRVKVGQVLARIDTSKLEAQVLQSEAALAAAGAKVLETEATIQEADAQLARLAHVRELSGGKVPSLYEYEAQQAAVARARASVASAKAEVSKAQGTLTVNRSDLGKAVIHSPVNGVVLSRLIEPGQTVAASFSAPVLFKLAEDLAKLELHVDVDEADVGQVREGQEATFTVDAYPDKHFPASITQVRYGSQTTDGVVTYTTVLKVNNDDLSLRPGMTATAVITTKELSDALLVPGAALRFEPPHRQAQAAGETSDGASLISSLLPHPPQPSPRPNEPDASDHAQRVYVLRDGNPCAVPVETGLSDGTLTEVRGIGLETGADVITGMTTGRK